MIDSRGLAEITGTDLEALTDEQAERIVATQLMLETEEPEEWDQVTFFVGYAFDNRDELTHAHLVDHTPQVEGFNREKRRDFILAPGNRAIRHAVIALLIPKELITQRAFDLLTYAYRSKDGAPSDHLVSLTVLPRDEEHAYNIEMGLDLLSMNAHGVKSKVENADRTED